MKKLFIIATLFISTSAQAQNYDAPDQELWNQFKMTADSLPIGGPANRQLMQLFESVEREAQRKAGVACSAGQIVGDANYLYTCASSGVWKRVAMTGGY